MQINLISFEFDHSKKLSFNNLYYLVLNLEIKKRGNKNEKKPLSFEKKHMSIASSTALCFELMKQYFNDSQIPSKTRCVIIKDHH